MSKRNGREVVYEVVSKWVINSSYTLNFDQGKKNEIQQHSYKERLRLSKTAKICC
jgi:hypothetical protein